MVTRGHSQWIKFCDWLLIFLFVCLNIYILVFHKIKNEKKKTKKKNKLKIIQKINPNAVLKINNIWLFNFKDIYIEKKLCKCVSVQDS
jgi:hypothetical protein